MKYVFPQDKVVPTRFGHTIEFLKDKPTHVPAAAVRDVIAVGAIPSDETDDQDENEVGAHAEPADPVARHAKIVGAMKSMEEDNVSGDFTANGIPKKAAIDKRLGFKLDSAELSALWTEYQQGKPK